MSGLWGLEDIGKLRANPAISLADSVVGPVLGCQFPESRFPYRSG